MLLTEQEYATAAKISAKTVRRLINQNRLPAEDYGTKGRHVYRIDPSARPTPKTPTASAPAVRQRRRASRRVSSSIEL